MRNLLVGSRLPLRERLSGGRYGEAVGLAAVYGAFALIAAIIFRSLSVHPF